MHVTQINSFPLDHSVSETEVRGLYTLAEQRARLTEIAEEAVDILEDPVLYQVLTLRDKARIDALRRKLSELDENAKAESPSSL